MLRGYEGSSARLRDIANNGEGRVLDVLGADLDVAFDVGANIGEWTARARLPPERDRCTPSRSHPRPRPGVTSATPATPACASTPSGLRRRPGTITIHHYPDHPALTTITDYPHDAESTTIEAPVSTGDAYMAEAGVDTSTS